MSKLPTQNDVARLAGVSTATVSRVVNGRGIVSPTIHDRVVQAIDTLQYVPNAGARALAMQRSGTLGAIIPTLNNAIFAEGINGFERVAQQLGYSLILSVSDPSSDWHAEQVRKMIERGVDGLLLVGNDHDQEVFERLDKAGVRCVCTWAFDEHARAPNIGFDNATAMYSVIDHLVEQGHRHFGMLAGMTATNDRARHRVEGVIARLNHHGIAFEARRVVEVEYSIAQSRKAFWQAIDNDITALVCGNDVLAYGAWLEAQAMGLDVPEQLSITGFDDLALSAELTPALTTIQVGADIMGAEAARALIAATEQQTSVVGKCLPTRLVARESTGPANVVHL
ncbi:MAG: LacI family DNA-binding transcriptional regulator [Granulosicoccus sp.]